MSATRTPVEATVVELPPFSGLDAVCPKCETTVEVTWHIANVTEDFPCKHVRISGEHMCRTCPCCGYGWMEATADAAGED